MLLKKINNYRIVKHVTRLGITQDFLAINEQIDKKVLLRVSKYTDGLKRRLQHITKVHASMNHLHIHDVYDFFEYDKFLCIVLKYLEAETLEKYLSKHAPLKWTTALKIAKQISDALAYMHENNVVSAGIKPSAILIENNRAYISKFNNIKKMPHDDTLPPDGFLATVRYSSPEQLLGFSNIVPQSDIWSLGILLYEMLTGKAPFDVPDSSENIGEEANGADKVSLEIGLSGDPHELLNQPLVFPEYIPQEVQELIKWMLQKDLSKRCGSCKELSERITWLLTVTNAFVAMPFDDKFQKVRQTIKSACAQMGVECYIVDEASETGDIVQKIRNNIKDSDFIIADMSPVGEEFIRKGQKVPNTNVAYEVGMSHAYDKNVILLTQDLSTLSFDIAQETAILYNEEKLADLELDLIKFISVILKKIKLSRDLVDEIL